MKSVPGPGPTGKADLRLLKEVSPMSKFIILAKNSFWKISRYWF